MRLKEILVLTLITFVVAACTSGTSVTRKPSKGIDYSQYQGTSTTAIYESYEGYSEEEDFVGESRSGVKSVYGDAVVVMASKKISLGRRAGAKEMKTFQTSLDKAYVQAKKTYMPAGFTYSMSPAGSVNPLSEMEVQCLLSEESSYDVGQKTCDLFFKVLRSEYAVALEEAKNNVAL